MRSAQAKTILEQNGFTNVINDRTWQQNVHASINYSKTLTDNYIMDNQEFKNEDYLDPKYWKNGIFYFNKNDKRIFPPKRNKYMGWTINFANPISIISLFAIIIFIVVVSSIFNTY